MNIEVVGGRGTTYFAAVIFGSAGRPFTTTFMQVAAAGPPAGHSCSVDSVSPGWPHLERRATCRVHSLRGEPTPKFHPAMLHARRVHLSTPHQTHSRSAETRKTRE